jgi:hypothetical protein
VAGAGQGSDVTATAELQVDPTSDDLAIRSWVVDVPPLP